MVIRSTYNYTCHDGDKGSLSEIEKAPESLVGKYRLLRPGGNVTVLGLAKMRAEARRIENSQSKI